MESHFNTNDKAPEKNEEAKSATSAISVSGTRYMDLQGNPIANPLPNINAYNDKQLLMDQMEKLDTEIASTKFYLDKTNDKSQYQPQLNAYLEQKKLLQKQIDVYAAINTENIVRDYQSTDDKTGVGTCAIWNLNSRAKRQDDRTATGLVNEFNNLGEDQKKAVLEESACFLQTVIIKNENNIDKKMGSTLSSTMISGNQLYTTQIGDSLAYVVRVNKFGKVSPLKSLQPADHAHNLGNAKENARVQSAINTVNAKSKRTAARIQDWKGTQPNTISYSEMRIAMTRSLGDNIFEDVGLIHDPETFVENIDEQPDEMWILIEASDGFNEGGYLTEEQIQEVLQDCVDKKQSATEIAAALGSAAMKARSEQGESVTDNITVMVTFVLPGKEPIARFMAVFDGHGGGKVADLAATIYPEVLRLEIVLEKISAFDLELARHLEKEVASALEDKSVAAIANKLHYHCDLSATIYSEITKLEGLLQKISVDNSELAKRLKTDIRSALQNKNISVTESILHTYCDVLDNALATSSLHPITFKKANATEVEKISKLTLTVINTLSRIGNQLATVFGADSLIYKEHNVFFEKIIEVIRGDIIKDLDLKNDKNALATLITELHTYGESFKKHDYSKYINLILQPYEDQLKVRPDVENWLNETLAPYNNDQTRDIYYQKLSEYYQLIDEVVLFYMQKYPDKDPKDLSTPIINLLNVLTLADKPQAIAIRKELASLNPSLNIQQFDNDIKLIMPLYQQQQFIHELKNEFFKDLEGRKDFDTKDSQAFFSKMISEGEQHVKAAEAALLSQDTGALIEAQVAHTNMMHDLQYFSDVIGNVLKIQPEYYKEHFSVSTASLRSREKTALLLIDNIVKEGFNAYPGKTLPDIVDDVITECKKESAYLPLKLMLNFVGSLESLRADYFNQMNTHILDNIFKAFTTNVPPENYMARFMPQAKPEMNRTEEKAVLADYHFINQIIVPMVAKAVANTTTTTAGPAQESMILEKVERLMAIKNMYPDVKVVVSMIKQINTIALNDAKFADALILQLSSAAARQDMAKQNSNLCMLLDQKILPFITQEYAKNTSDAYNKANALITICATINDSTTNFDLVNSVTDKLMPVINSDLALANIVSSGKDLITIQNSFGNQPLPAQFCEQFMALSQIDNSDTIPLTQVFSKQFLGAIKNKTDNEKKDLLTLFTKVIQPNLLSQDLTQGISVIISTDTLLKLHDAIKGSFDSMNDEVAFINAIIKTSSISLSITSDLLAHINEQSKPEHLKKDEMTNFLKFIKTSILDPMVDANVAANLLKVSRESFNLAFEQAMDILKPFDFKDKYQLVDHLIALKSMDPKDIPVLIKNLNTIHETMDALLEMDKIIHKKFPIAPKTKDAYDELQGHLKARSETLKTLDNEISKFCSAVSMKRMAEIAKAEPETKSDIDSETFLNQKIKALLDGLKPTIGERAVKRIKESIERATRESDPQTLKDTLNCYADHILPALLNALSQQMLEGTIKFVELPSFKTAFFIEDIIGANSQEGKALRQFISADYQTTQIILRMTDDINLIATILKKPNLNFKQFSRLVVISSEIYKFADKPTHIHSIADKFSDIIITNEKTAEVLYTKLENRIATLNAPTYSSKPQISKGTTLKLFNNSVLYHLASEAKGIKEFIKYPLTMDRVDPILDDLTELQLAYNTEHTTILFPKDTTTQYVFLAIKDPDLATHIKKDLITQLNATPQMEVKDKIIKQYGSIMNALTSNVNVDANISEIYKAAMTNIMPLFAMPQFGFKDKHNLLTNLITLYALNKEFAEAILKYISGSLAKKSDDLDNLCKYIDLNMPCLINIAQQKDLKPNQMIRSFDVLMAIKDQIDKDALTSPNTTYEKNTESNKQLLALFTNLDLASSEAAHSLKTTFIEQLKQANLPKLTDLSQLFTIILPKLTKYYSDPDRDKTKVINLYDVKTPINDLLKIQANKQEGIKMIQDSFATFTQKPPIRDLDTTPCIQKNESILNSACIEYQNNAKITDGISKKTKDADKELMLGLNALCAAAEIIHSIRKLYDDKMPCSYDKDFKDYEKTGVTAQKKEIIQALEAQILEAFSQYPNVPITDILENLYKAIYTSYSSLRLQQPSKLTSTLFRSSDSLPQCLLAAHSKIGKFKNNLEDTPAIGNRSLIIPKQSIFDVLKFE